MATTQTSDPELFLHIPFTRRWEYHKNTIHDLYITQGRSINDIADIMKLRYNVRQYKYHIKQWGMTKIVPKDVKDAAVKAIGKRVRTGTAVAGVKYKGEEIDKKRLRRHLRDESRLDRDWILIGVIFGAWNLPYKALKASSSYIADYPSPFHVDGLTPSDLSILSPINVSGTSPVHGPTPTTLAIRQKMRNDRARYLIQGRNEEFLRDMSEPEKRVTTTWLYQFWFFAFTTSKYWGRGPRNWTPYLLGFQKFSDAFSTPNTPAALVYSSSNGPGQGVNGDASPTSLCHWGIHCVSPGSYEGIPSPPPEEDIEFDVEENSTRWPRWNEMPKAEIFVERLSEALRHNAFSSINTQDLPLETNKIATAVSNSPNMLQVEGIGFAIISRNVELLEELLENTYNLDLSGLFPFHLAATYLDGTATCCHILHIIVGLGGRNLIKNLYINNLGHTVLDSLMMSILKGHSSCTPVMVDDRLKKTQRFAGEDVDICGRWDADSHCVRTVNAKGSSRLSISWKHMFCHTSIQAICHAITVVFGRFYSPDINQASGLFVKTCSPCGKRLAPGPIHTLVLVAFYLSAKGCEGENLFGVLACLVCLLSHGADPTIRADMSVRELFSQNDTSYCDHKPLCPVELAEQVPESIWSKWTDDVKLGWETMVAVLRFAQRERQCEGKNLREPTGDIGQMLSGVHGMDGIALDYLSTDQSDSEASDEDESSDECFHEDEHNFYSGSKQLGTLWAAIQTEMLTYRRLRVGDPWISKNFDMRIVRDAMLEDDDLSELEYIKRGMMTPWCKCGRFKKAYNDQLPTMDEACAFYFSNMEDWNRSTFLLVPDIDY